MVNVSQADIAKYLYNRLLKAGYTPSSDEVLDLAIIVSELIEDEE